MSSAALAKKLLTQVSPLLKTNKMTLTFETIPYFLTADSLANDYY